MKFNISSSLLSQTLQSASKVLSSKSSLPILDYFLFEIKEDKLRLTASDSEIIMRSILNIVNQDGIDASFAIQSRRMIDSLKELSEQPLTFDVDTDTWDVVVIWSSGNLKLTAVAGDGYPAINDLSDNFSQITLSSEILETGMSNTIFAAEQTTQLRPVMQGVLMDIEDNRITFVGTNGQHLAKFEAATEQTVEQPASLIVPSKTVNLIRSLCSKENNETILQFDSKNILFKIGSNILMSRLIEGNYPRYRQVIPQSNPRIATIDRASLLSAVKRVSACCNPVSGLIMLDFLSDKVVLKCSDAGFGLSAEDTVNIQYNDEPLTIGFKAQYLQEVLSIIDTDEIEIQLADEVRPGVFVPKTQPEGENFLVILMPITMN